MPPTPARNLEPVPDETPIPEGVVFEEPPTPGRAAAADRFAAELAAVRTRPGQWARIHTWSSPSSASASAKSLRTKPPAGRWEFRGSKFGDNGSALYVRFIGP